jgi:hypothetical protein
MKTYLIEREIPGIERMSADEYGAIARRSNKVLADLGHSIQWLHSYVVVGKTICVYSADDEELIREHSRISGFPVNRITQVKGMLDPTMGRA